MIQNLNNTTYKIVPCHLMFIYSNLYEFAIRQLKNQSKLSSANNMST